MTETSDDNVTRVSWAGECRRIGEQRKIVNGNASYQTATRLPAPLPFT